jgi:hypothetical protein
MRVLSRIARLGAAAVGLLSATSSLAPAQAGTWDLSLVLAPTLPSRVDLLATQAGYLTMVVTYTGTGLANFEVRSRLSASGGLSASASSVPRAATGPGTHIFSNTTRALVDDPTLVLPRAWELLATRGGALPPDRYRFCATVFVDGAAVTAERCATTVVEAPQPPVLLLPSDVATITTAMPTFVWTPATQVDATSRLRYRLRIAELPAGRLPAEALGGLAWHEAEVEGRAQYVYPLSALPLRDGMTYAWQVTAYDADGKPYGVNGGRSRIQRFVLRDPAAAASLGAVEVVVGIAEIASLRGVRVIGGDVDRLVVSGPVPLRLTIGAGAPREITAMARDLVIARTGASPRVIGGELDATVDLPVAGDARIRRLRRAPDGSLQFAGVIRVGGIDIPATGTTARNGPLLGATAPAGAALARIGNDTAAVLVRKVTLARVGATVQYERAVELFGEPAPCAPMVTLDSATATVDLLCSSAPASRAPVTLTSARGRFRVSGTAITQADLQLGLRETMPFTSGLAELQLTGRFTRAEGLSAFTTALTGRDPSLRFGALRVRLRTVARAQVGWRANEGWSVRAPARADVELPSVALRVMALDSVMITASGLELPAIERDGTVLGMAALVSGSARVRPTLVRWPATTLAWGDGAPWRATLGGVGAVASTSACVQGVTVPAPRGLLTTTRLDWPFDTARVDGQCVVRKPNGSTVAIVAVSGAVTGVMAADTIALTGSVSTIERTLTAATAPDTARGPLAPEIPFTIRVPGGAVALRDGAGRALVTVRRVDERTLAFTPIAATLPFTLAGGVTGTARADSVRYDTRSQRLSAGTLRVAFVARDTARRVPLAALPAEVDSLVVRGDPLAPAGTLHATPIVHGRPMGGSVAFAVNESSIASGAFDVADAAAPPQALVAGGAVTLQATRVSGSVRIPLSGGPSTRDLIVTGELRALGLAHRLRLRMPTGGEGAATVLAADPVPSGAAAAPGVVRLDSLQVSRLVWSAANGFAFRFVGAGQLMLPLRDGSAMRVPIASALLDEREVAFAATRTGADSAVSTLTEGVSARATSWDLPAFRTSWSAIATARPASVSGDLQLRFARTAALATEWFGARITWRADSTVCGTAEARPLARAVTHRQGGAELSLTAVAPLVPACNGGASAFGARVTAAVVRNAPVSASAAEWPLVAPLALAPATGLLTGGETVTLGATAAAGALQLTLGAGRVDVTPDTVRWTGRAEARLASAGAGSPAASADASYDLGRGRLSAGRFEITTPFTWRLASGNGVVAVTVPRAVFDADGATFSGEGTVVGTPARILFDQLRLGGATLAVTGGSARVTGTLPLALDNAGWRVATSGLVTLPLVDPLLDATGLSAAVAGQSAVAMPALNAPGLDARLGADFRFDADAGGVLRGRVDLFDGTAPNAARRAWIDSTGVNIVGAVAVVPDSLALPSFDIAYVRLRANGQQIVATSAGANGALSINTGNATIDVIVPALGGLSVAMQGSLTIDQAGQVSGGSLAATLPAAVAIPGARLPFQLRGLSFGRVNGAFGLRASVSAPQLPGLPEITLPAVDLSLTASGLSGTVRNGTCAAGGAPIATQAYASGALTVKLLGIEADLTARTLCARLEAVALLGGAGATPTTIPVSATWNVGSGAWLVTGTAQALPEMTLGSAVLTPDLLEGLTVRATAGSFALVVKGAVRFPALSGDAVAIDLEQLRIATDGISAIASNDLPQTIGLFDDLVTLRTTRVVATYASGALAVAVDGGLTLAGEAGLTVSGLTFRSTGALDGGAVSFARPASLLGGRLSLGSLAFSAQGGRMRADIGGSLTLPAPFGAGATAFTIGVRPQGAGWNATLALPALAFGTGMRIGDNTSTEIEFGDVATFDLLGLGISLDLRAPANASITAAAALYLMNDTDRAIVFGDPAHPTTAPGLRIDGGGVEWNATFEGDLPTLDLGLFRYALTGFGGVSAGNSFGFEFAGQASLDVPGVSGTLALEGLRIGLDGVTPGGLGAGPHELSLLEGIATFRIGAFESGTNTALTLTSAGAAGSANSQTTTVQAAEFVRIRNAGMTLGFEFFEGSVEEVLIYRLANGDKSIGVIRAALSLAGSADVQLSMRYVNGNDGMRLSAGGSATIIGSTGFGAAGFFSNRDGDLGAGLFVAAAANIPLLPPLISLAGIGGGLYINPTGEDIQFVLDVVEGIGLRLVGEPPELPGPGRTLGFATFLYADAGLIGAGGAYAIQGKAFLQVTSAYTRIDARGVLLGMDDNLAAGVMLEVRYGDGWTVLGRGEATVDFPGVGGNASLDFLLSRRNGRFTWAIDAHAALDVVAFNAYGDLMASQDGFFAEVGIGSGFEYGPVEINSSVMVGVFLDASRPKFGIYGEVRASVEILSVEASARLKGALVLDHGIYLGFSGVGKVRVAGITERAAVHASFDHGDFDAGFGRDKNLDKQIAEMRGGSRRLKRATDAAASALREELALEAFLLDDATLNAAAFALLNLSEDQRDDIFRDVLASEERVALPAALDARIGNANSPSEYRRWVHDSVIGDPRRPRASDVNLSRDTFEGVADLSGSAAATVLERLSIVLDDASEVVIGEVVGGSPVTATRTPGLPLRLTLDAAAYDATVSAATAGRLAALSLDDVAAMLAQAEAALDSIDAALEGGGLRTTTLLYAAAAELLEQWQAERLAVGDRASFWANNRSLGMSTRSIGARDKLREGWRQELAAGRMSYSSLIGAALRRRLTVYALAALSPEMQGETALEDHNTFRQALIRLDTIPGRDDRFLDVVASTWEELWRTLPQRGLNAVRTGAPLEARALAPVMIAQRDTMVRYRRVLTDAVAELYAARLEMTGHVAALYDEARARPGAPAAWLVRRDELMLDLEPPALSALRVTSQAHDGVTRSELRWDATHPNGLGGSNAVMSRDATRIPQYIGRAAGVNTLTARETAEETARSYGVAVRAHSVAGASVDRRATLDVPLPQNPIQNLASTPSLTQAPDQIPQRPTASLDYILLEPLPLAMPAGRIGNENVTRFENVMAAAADVRVHFTADPTALDITVDGIGFGYFAAIEVAIGTTRTGEQVRAFSAAPYVRTGGNTAVLMLRGLALAQDVDHWIRVRVRGVSGLLSPEYTLPNALRVDARGPVPPTLRAYAFGPDQSALVQLTAVEHAPSGLRMFEWVISRSPNAEAVFGAFTPTPWGSDTVRIPAADLSPGDTTWLHIRAVSYAGGRGPIRSIPVRPPPDLSGIAAGAAAAPNVPGYTPPGPSFSPILAPAVRPPTAPTRAPTVPNAVPNGVRNSPTIPRAVTPPEVR